VYFAQDPPRAATPLHYGSMIRVAMKHRMVTAAQVLEEQLLLQPPPLPLLFLLLLLLPLLCALLMSITCPPSWPLTAWIFR